MLRDRFAGRNRAPEAFGRHRSSDERRVRARGARSEVAEQIASHERRATKRSDAAAGRLRRLHEYSGFMPCDFVSWEKPLRRRSSLFDTIRIPEAREIPCRPFEQRP